MSVSVITFIDLKKTIRETFAQLYWVINEWLLGLAYHLRQRQRYNITLEVADFDFQPNEDLNEKTFFERLRESFAKSLRGTLLHPCTRAQNYDDLIDDELAPNEQNVNNENSTHIKNTNDISYEVIK